MNRYETVCIVRPDIAEDAIKGIIQKASSSLEGAGGTVIRVDEWGRKKLAYPIQKKGEGYYFVLQYMSSPEASKEIERLFKLSEDVLRYQTIRIIATKKAEEKTAEAPAAAAEAAPAEGGQANG
ncbi:MAG: 30S ribosomal protein S6 [Deltaproteobacteria bacterium]|nr:30S ribosomal protein S6 [Deltaproteobacteria bacterium]MCL4874440.1 30S ribosomal protein S6 [bacterium]